MNQPDYPAFICHKCGTEHGNGPQREFSTWHYGTCDICGEVRSVTEPRDFGHLKPTWKEARK